MKAIIVGGLIIFLIIASIIYAFILQPGQEVCLVLTKKGGGNASVEFPSMGLNLDCQKNLTVIS